MFGHGLFWECGKGMGMRKMENSYNALKREVASALSLCLFGTRRRKQLKAKDKAELNELMSELDKTFKMHGVDWKLNE